jgi:hypothetical protein
MERESSLPYSQQLTIGPYPEPYEYNSRTSILLLQDRF